MPCLEVDEEYEDDVRKDVEGSQGYEEVLVDLVDGGRGEVWLGDKRGDDGVPDTQEDVDAHRAENIDVLQ